MRKRMLLKLSILLLSFSFGFMVNVLPMGFVVKAHSSDGLLGYWKFDDGSGTIASDSSGNNKHGTIYEARWIRGKAGYALWFDGADDHVDFPILYSSSPSALTVVAWIRFPMTSVDIHRTIVWHGDNGEFELRFRYDAWDWGEAIFQVKLETGVWSSVGAGEIPKHEWHQIAGVWTRADKIKIYKDGILTAEQPVGDYALFDSGPTFARGVIGAYHDSVDYSKHFRGEIDEVRIYNRALSVDEIIALRDNPQPIELADSSEEVDTNNLHRYEITYTDHVNGGPISYFEPETLIAQTSSNEMHVRKAVDSNGDVHIAWMSSRLGQWEVYYKEISSDGTVKVPVELISDTPYNSMFPSIALDSSDDAHIVWTDRRDDAGITWEIYYSKIQDNTGTDLTSPDWRVSNSDGKDSGRAVQPANPIDDAVTPLFIEHPDIDVDSQNDVHIVWSDYRDGNWEIYCQKQTNAATPVVSIDDQSISSLDGFNSHNPAVSAGPDISGDGLPDIHIVWQDNRDGNWEIYYEKLTGTNALVNDKTLTIDDNYHSATPDIDVDTTGHPHIVFIDQRPTDPEHAGEDTHLYSSPYWEIYTMALDKTTGDVLHNRDGTKRYEVRQSDMVGGSWWGSYTGTTLGDGPSMYPRITVTGSFWSYGVTYIAWHDYRKWNQEIYFSIIQNWCNNPMEDQRITNNPNSDMYPDIALNSQGKPNIVWQRFDGAKWSILNTDYRSDQWVRVIIDRGTPTEQTYDMFRLDSSDTDSSDGITYVFGGSFTSETQTYTIEARNYEYTATPLPPLSVGGIWVPVDKFGLLAPYIALAATIIVATATTAIHAKRVKRRKEKR